jgi:hypothetical protein
MTIVLTFYAFSILKQPLPPFKLCKLMTHSYVGLRQCLGYSEQILNWVLLAYVGTNSPQDFGYSCSIIILLL